MIGDTPWYEFIGSAAGVLILVLLVIHAVLITAAVGLMIVKHALLGLMYVTRLTIDRENVLNERRALAEAEELKAAQLELSILRPQVWLTAAVRDRWNRDAILRCAEAVAAKIAPNSHGEEREAAREAIADALENEFLTHCEAVEGKPCPT